MTIFALYLNVVFYVLITAFALFFIFPLKAHLSKSDFILKILFCLFFLKESLLYLRLIFGHTFFLKIFGLLGLLGTIIFFYAFVMTIIYYLEQKKKIK
jgi:hypothetical protein